MSRSTRTLASRRGDFSIPGKFVVIIQPNTAPRQPQPPVIGHCLLCLRRLREPTGIQNLKIGESLDDLPIVPKAVLSEADLLPTFNKLLPFIHRKWKPKKRKTDPLDLLNKNVPEYCHQQNQAPDSGSTSNLPKNFPHLPAMCVVCGHKLEQLDGLVRQLEGKIEEIRGTIKMSKMPEGMFGWRQLQFEDDLRNNQDLNEVARKKTMEFLEEFGEVMEEDDEGEEEEEAVVVEATGEGGDEEDPLASNEHEGEEEDFEVKIEVEEENEVDGEEEWRGPQVKREPESGPSYESRKRAKRRSAPGPVSKLGGGQEQPSGIIREEGEGGPSPRRSSRIIIDKGRTLSLSSSSLSSAVKGPPVVKKFYNG